MRVAGGRGLVEKDFNAGDSSQGVPGGIGTRGGRGQKKGFQKIRKSTKNFYCEGVWGLDRTESHKGLGGGKKRSDFLFFVDGEVGWQSR